MTEQYQASLVVEKGITELSVIPLNRGVCILGTAPSADVVLDSPYVSHLHAQIVREGGNYRLTDLRSKNGTSLNGDVLEEKGALLHHGDRIELAIGHVVLRFQERRRTLTVPVPKESEAGDLVVDSDSREVWVSGDKIEPPLSLKEFDVLDLLYQRRGAACSRDVIAETGWPERGGGDVGDHEIDQCIRRIRLRIEPDPSQPKFVVTVRGYGYRLL